MIESIKENEVSWGMITTPEAPWASKQQWKKKFMLIPLLSSSTSKERLSFVL